MAHSRAKFHLEEMPGPSIIKKGSSVIPSIIWEESLIFSQGAFCFKKVVDDPPFGYLDNIIPPIFLANLIFSKALD
jgi:hypothetical protein